MDFIARSVSFVACAHRSEIRRSHHMVERQKSVEGIKLSFNFTQSFFMWIQNANKK
jgi:hypothetical protein